MNKDLAYIVGVFLGDGSAIGRTFSLQTIDVDFAVMVAESMGKLTKNHVLKKEIPRRTKAGHVVYAVVVNDTDLCCVF